MPSDWFDALLITLDMPDPALRLASGATDARRHGRISVETALGIE